ncbi:MAG: hypothetical protein SF172_15160 [Burkholderiales bacterium]|nr:hypothetical protein [Burkholderiales bacterium]
MPPPKELAIRRSGIPVHVLQRNGTQHLAWQRKRLLSTPVVLSSLHRSKHGFEFLFGYVRELARCFSLRQLVDRVFSHGHPFESILGKSEKQLTLIHPLQRN